jgi:hypothetical protein
MAGTHTQSWQVHSTMAPRPKRGSSSYSSPSAASCISPDPSASSVSSPEPSGRYVFAVPPATHVRLLQILSGAEEYVAHHQIYNQNPSLFGVENSILRKQVKNHRYYLERLRKSNEKKFNGFCAAQGVALRGADQQQSGEPSAPSTSMSRRNNRKCNVECGA